MSDEIARERSTSEQIPDFASLHPGYAIERSVRAKSHSSRIHKTNPMEPEIARNIARRPSLSARAMQSPGEYPMSNRFMMSVAIAALIAGTGFANAQGAGTSREAPAAAATQSAPPSERAAPSAATPMNRNDAAPSAADAPKSAQSDEKMPQGGKNQRAQDTAPGQKSKSMSSENDKGGAAKDMKAEDRNGNMNRADDRNGAAKSTTTTGQAGAGAKLSTEQRTKITTVIKSQNVRPVTNVNFSISVGARVPRGVGFHPLPVEIVTIYPEWRGYEFILVNNQILVINPRTLEIVDVIDA
jgi:hypothetical protein